jgi:hypothetical protein
MKCFLWRLLWRHGIDETCDVDILLGTVHIEYRSKFRQPLRGSCLWDNAIGFRLPPAQADWTKVILKTYGEAHE